MKKEASTHPYATWISKTQVTLFYSGKYAICHQNIVYKVVFKWYRVFKT